MCGNVSLILKFHCIFQFKKIIYSFKRVLVYAIPKRRALFSITRRHGHSVRGLDGRPPDSTAEIMMLNVSNIFHIIFEVIQTASKNFIINI